MRLLQFRCVSHLQLGNRASERACHQRRLGSRQGLLLVQRRHLRATAFVVFTFSPASFEHCAFFSSRVRANYWAFERARPLRRLVVWQSPPRGLPVSLVVGGVCLLQCPLAIYRAHELAISVA